MLQIDPNLHHNNLVNDTTMCFKEENLSSKKNLKALKSFNLKVPKFCISQNA